MHGISQSLVIIIIEILFVNKSLTLARQTHRLARISSTNNNHDNV